MKQAARVAKLQARIREWSESQKKHQETKVSQRMQSGGYKCPGSYK